MSSGRSRMNRDGSINTQHVGGQPLSLSDAYHWLVTLSWTKFFIFISCTYLVLSLLFALGFSLDGENFKGIDEQMGLKSYWQLFLFSAQTLSTIGGIGVTPGGLIGNSLFTIETMVALLCMTLMTGLLYARFSTQSIRLVYSEKGLISPFREGTALMIRVANDRKTRSAFVELEAEVYFIWYENETCNKRSVEIVPLEMKKVSFLPISWTIVHPINARSPFSKYNLNEIDFEILVRVQGLDSITGQTVFSRRSYHKKDLVWKARFTPCSEVNEAGVTIVYLDKIGDHEMLEFGSCGHEPIRGDEALQ